MTAKRVYLACLTVDLRLAGTTSLKDKRMVLRSLKDGARRAFGVAVAEVDGYDDLHYAKVMLAALATSRPQADAILAGMTNHIERRFGFYDLSLDSEVIEL